MFILNRIKFFLLKNYLFQIVIITIIGLGFRIYGIVTVPVAFDEAHNILLSRSNDPILMVKAAVEAYPPLYFFLWHAWQSISNNLIFLRSLSLIFGVLTIPLIGFIGKKLFSRETGLIAAFLVAFSPSQIYYSSIARMYSLTVLLSLLIIYSFTKTIKTKSSRTTFIFGILMILGLYTHFYFVILLIVLNIYFFLFQKNSLKSIMEWLILQVLILLSYTPVIFLMLDSPRAFAEPANSLLKIPLFFIIPILPWEIILNSYFIQFNQFDFLSAFATCSIVLTLFIFTWGIVSERKNEFLKLFTLIFILSIFVITLISYTFFRIMNLRAFIIFSPLFYLVLAFSIQKLVKKTGVFLPTLICSLFVIFSLIYSSNNFNQKDVMRQIYSNFSESDFVVYNDVILYLPSKILQPHGKHFLMFPGYFGEGQYKALDVAITPISKLSKIDNRLWYIKQETNWSPYEELTAELENYLQVNFIEVKRTPYYKFQVILYQPKKVLMSK